MPAFKPLTESDNVRFELSVEADDIPVRGNAMASGDDDADRECENELIERLESGDETAWCHVRVVATDPETELEGEDSLGCVSLEPGAMNPTAIERRLRAAHPELWSEALARLNEARLAAHTPQVVRMCKTDASRDRNGNTWVRARHVTTSKRKRIAWDGNMDEYENHANAAALVLGRRPEFSSSVDGGGYIMGVDPRNDA